MSFPVWAMPASSLAWRSHEWKGKQIIFYNNDVELSANKRDHNWVSRESHYQEREKNFHPTTMAWRCFRFLAQSITFIAWCCPAQSWLMLSEGENLMKAEQTKLLIKIMRVQTIFKRHRKMLSKLLLHLLQCRGTKNFFCQRSRRDIMETRYLCFNVSAFRPANNDVGQKVSPNLRTMRGPSDTVNTS